jgi:hypothetical protein
VAIQPEPAAQQGGPRAGDTAELLPGRTRRRRPLLALIFALAGLCGLAVAAFGINGQLKPRQFTASQQRKIEAWEMARRWRTIPATQIFPAVVGYRVGGGVLGSSGTLALSARRLEIAPQATCAVAAGVRPQPLSLLEHGGCQALLRATYVDATGSLVVTVGVSVLKDQQSATAVARYLSGHDAAGQGHVTRQPVLDPLQVAGTAAAVFSVRQRQLSWIVGAGPYLVIATVGYSDGRPRVHVGSDSYTDMEMTSLARGIASAIAAPLGAAPAVPRCPGALSAC